MNLVKSAEIRQNIIGSLQDVIDPETKANVIRMRFVTDLTVGSEGQVSYTFKPSSPLCPIAGFLVKQIKQAVSEVDGVTAQQITVAGYVAAKELTELINKE